MKKFLSGSAIAAGVLLAGLMAGYWHFADLMPRREQGAPPVADAPASEIDDSRTPAPPQLEQAAVKDAPTPQETEPTVGGSEPSQEVETLAEDGDETVAAIAPPADEDAPAMAPDEPIESAVVEEAPTTAPDNAPGDQGDAPSFDLLRVEPDGSAVVAGRSAPGSEIVLRRGGDILGRDTAGPSGDFALALEAPLGVGDHALQLETVDPQGRALTSTETAIVSVPPRGREEELLVVVEAPNAPSRILAVPSAIGESESVVASAPEAEDSAAQETQTAMLPSSAGQASDAAGDDIEAAAIVAVPSIENPAGEADAASELAIAAVEIEGERIYIAGTAKRGATIRLYLDDALIAESMGGAGGEFIAEAVADVPVGPHIVRADQIGADGAVIARVEVPFDRPEGTSMAAMAPVVQPPEMTPETEAAPLDDTSREPDVVPVDAAPPEPEPADTVVTAAAPDAPPPAPPTPTPAAPGPSAGGRPETVTRDAQSIRADTPDAPDEMVPAAAPASLPPTREPAREPVVAATSDRVESRAAAPVEATPPAPVVTAARTQAALEPVDGRVIIRRGDTLWRISKNAYGLGSRYSVIYLANGDQIRDPDRIYPGQVFRMPGGRKAEGRSVLN